MIPIIKFINMKNLWTFGCSYTAEYYPVDNPNSPSVYDKFKKWRGGNLPPTWPTLLSQKLNFKINNMAKGGSSNYAIFNQFIDVCEKIESGDILIFGWTGVARFQMANIKENIFKQILPNQNDYELYTLMSNQTIDEILVNRSNDVWCTEVMNWIKFINLFCDKINTKVFHWTSDERLFNRDLSLNLNERFIFVKDNEFINRHGHNLIGYLLWPKHNNLRNFAKISDETDEEVNDGHFGEKGHEFQSNFFYNHIIQYL